MATPPPAHDDGVIHLRRPSMDDFIFAGEETPLLFRRKVVFSMVGVLLLAIAGYIGASAWFGFDTQIDAEPFKNWVEDLGILGPIAYILVLAFSVLFAPIPNVPIFIAAGLAWGPILGTAYSMVGLLLGSAMAFYAARWLGRRHLPRLIGAKGAQRLDSLADTMGGRLIFWARILPGLSFDWVSYVAGVTAMRFWTFMFASALGLLLPTTVGVIAGDGLGRDIRLTLAAGGLWVLGAVLSGLYFWLRRRRWLKQRAALAHTVSEGAER